MTLDDLYGICETYNVDFSDYIIIKEHVEELEATIEAQEIIIKDKTAIMEAMTQNKVKCMGDLCSHIITSKISGKL